MLVKYNSYLQTKDYTKRKLNYFDNLRYVLHFGG